MGRDLDRRAAGGLDESPHSIDMLLNAVGLGLPVDIYENVVGVVMGEHAVPVGFVPSLEVELIHALEVAGYLVVRHDLVSFRDQRVIRAGAYCNWSW
jgi:hypothetical protein